MKKYSEKHTADNRGKCKRKELINKPSPAFVVFANAQTQLLPVLNLLHARKVLPTEHSSCRHVLLAIRTRFAQSVRKSALTKREGIKNHFLTSLPTNLLTFKPAFTLAEVLITLGIIGIVAAMTIPTLMTKIQKHQVEAQLKETYSVIQQAMRNAQGEGSDLRNYFGENEVKSWFKEFIEPNIKVTNVCYQTPGCWHKYNEAKDLNGKRYEYDNNPSNVGWGAPIVTFTIPKGAYFNMDGYNMDSCKNKFGINTNESCLGIFFDVNGDKKPNVIGKDIYMVIQTENGLVPAGKDKTQDEVNNNCNKGNGVFCLQKVINEGWKISDKIWKR